MIKSYITFKIGVHVFFQWRELNVSIYVLDHLLESIDYMGVDASLVIY